jgi:hypothetical protein
MTDRIRANDGAFASYAGIDTDNDYDQDCEANPCTAIQMVNSDAQAWKTNVETLPSGRGLITQPTPTTLVVSVMWDDEGTGATGTDCGNDPEVDLTCYSITISTVQ